MRTTINKNELLKTITNNRDQHEKDFKESAEKYEKSVYQSVVDLLKKIELRSYNHKDLGKPALLPKPQSYLSSYNRAIEMIERHADTTIQLSEEDFAHLVQDNWDWSSRFRIVSNTYTPGKFKDD